MSKLGVLLVVFMFVFSACKSGGGGGAASSGVAVNTSNNSATDEAPSTEEDSSIAEAPADEAEEEADPTPIRIELSGLDSSFSLDADDTTETPQSYALETKIIPDSNLQVTGQFQVSSVSIDTQMRLEFKGKTSSGANLRYFMRVRRSKVDIYASGPSGAFHKRLSGEIKAGTNYPFEFLFYDNALVLSLRLESEDQLTQKHVIFEDLKSGDSVSEFEVIGYIRRGNGEFSNISYKKFGEDAEDQYLLDDGQITEGVLVTRAAQLESHLSGTGFNTSFYKTDTVTSPAIDEFYGSNSYWSTFSGRFNHVIDGNKVIQWNFTTDDLTNLYAQFRSYGRLDGKGVNYNIILNKNNASFYHTIDGQKVSQTFLSNLKPNTAYTAEMLHSIFGKAIYFYETSEPRPEKPQHIFPSGQIDSRNYFQILRGRLTGFSERQLSGAHLSSFPSELALTYSTLLDDTSLWKSGKSDEDGRWVAFRDQDEMAAILDASYAKYYPEQTPPLLLLKSDGTKYTKFSDDVIYNRNPASEDEGIKGKGHHFEITFDDQDLDPILILALEGRNQDNVYKRQGIVFRHNRVYAQYRKASSNSYVNYNIHNPYDLSGTIHVKLEAYPDGTAIYLYKEGEEVPTEPVFVVSEAPFEKYNWRAWTYRNLENIKIHPAYDLTQSLAANTYTIGEGQTTLVSREEEIFGKSSTLTTIDGASPFDVENNSLTLQGDDKRLSVVYNYPEVFDRTKDLNISFEVSVTNSGSSYSQLWVELFGSAPKGVDAVELRGRRHWLEFWKNEVFARTSGPGLMGGHGYEAMNGLESDTFYRVEIVATPMGSSFKIAPVETFESAKAQSYFYLGDFDPRLRFRLRNGSATLRNLVVTQSEEDSVVNLAANVDLATDIGVLAHGNLPGTPFDCWYNQTSTFFEQLIGGQKVLKVQADVRRFWENLSCTTPIQRTPASEVSVTFQTPAELTSGSQFVIGIKGYNKRRYRRHNLLLTRTNSTTLRAFSQLYTRDTGWKKYQQTDGIVAGQSYTLTINVTADGSTLTLQENFGEANVVLFHQVTRDEFPGSLGPEDSQVADFTPHFTIMNRTDDIIVESIEVK